MMKQRMVVAGLCGVSIACSVQPPATPAPVPESGTPRSLSYDIAVHRIEARQAEDDTVSVAGGRSILLTHGGAAPRVFVLLHGFSDAPTQFRSVGEHLFATGANVYIPRLPHHAERTAPLRALSRVRADELARFADSTAEIARGLGDTVIVVGLSAGGVIAGAIAQSHHIGRAVLIAPAIAPGVVGDDEGATLTLLASRLRNIERNVPTDTTRPENVPGITTRGLAELLQLGRRVRDAAGRTPAAAPNMVFLLNEADRTVSETAALDLAQRWFDRGGAVVAYRFDADAKLPHNVMELTSRGGNVELVYPVVEALALGEPPPTVKLLGVPCRGFRCNLRRWVGANPR